MKSSEEMRNKYFTKKGEEALFNRLETLIELYKDNKQQFPLRVDMNGFVPLTIYSRESLLGMINELRQVLNISKININIVDGSRVQSIEVV